MNFFLVLVLIGNLIVWYLAKRGGYKTEEGKVVIGKGRKFTTIALIIWLVAAGLLIKPFTIVPADCRGLLFTLGAIEKVELDPGLHFKIPLLQTIKTFTIRPIQKDYVVNVGPDGAITKDNQTIGADFTIFYVFKKGEFVSMYKDFGEEKLANIVLSTTIESFKANIGKYDIFMLPTSQDKIRMETLEQLRAKLNNYPIQITELKITNYEWSDAFDKQIAETMDRAQKVKQKEQELLMTEKEAQKKVKEAEADKTALITKAEGRLKAAELEALAKERDGEGVRKYNEHLEATKQLEIELRKLEIEKLRVQKWDGRYVPNNNYSPIPFSTGGLQPEIQ